MDAELKRRDQYLEDALKQRDEECKKEIEEMDSMWRKELQERDEIFWNEARKQEYNLCEMLEKRDLALKEALKERDQEWLNSLNHCKESVRLMTLEQINNRSLMETLSKRQRELTEGNAKILDWAMKTISGKKKVPLPYIRVSNCIPFTIVPLDEQNPPKLFTNPDKGEIPFTPCRVLPKDETYGTIKCRPRTPEEIEKYNNEQASKPSKPSKPAIKSPKENKRN